MAQLWAAREMRVPSAAGTVRGTVVIDRGDINSSIERYVESAVTLRIEDDHVIEVIGDGVDAELMRDYYAVWRVGRSGRGHGRLLGGRVSRRQASARAIRRAISAHCPTSRGGNGRPVPKAGTVTQAA